jgi:hypothetical protein
MEADSENCMLRILMVALTIIERAMTLDGKAESECGVHLPPVKKVVVR